MKTDLYTKTILTIIAIALVILALQNTNVVPKAHAQDMVPCAVSSAPIDVNIVSVNGYQPFGADGTLKMELISPVQIKEPRGGLDVHVNNTVDVRSASMSGLDVYVTNK